MSLPLIRRLGLMAVSGLILGAVTLSAWEWCQAETPIKVLSASATSSADDSLPVVNLLDLNQEGSWKPKSLDSGSNEGLFFQFQNQVLIDRIEVKVKNGADNFWVSYYLDGKVNVPKNTAKPKGTAKPMAIAGNQVEYSVEMKDSGPDRTIIMGARKAYDDRSPGLVAPLNVKVQSLFIRIDHAGPAAKVVAVRFFRKESSQPLAIKVPLFKQGNASASSTLEPKTAYSILNLFDSRLDFAWATDGKKSNGVGESFTVTLNNPVALSGLIIWNGYQRSTTHYQANSRLAKIRVGLDNGREFSLPVKDQSGSQAVQFPETVAAVRRVTITVEGIFPGGSYKDLVVSEFRMVDGTGNVIIIDIPELKMEINNPDLQRMVDITLEQCLFGIVSEPGYDRNNYANSYEAADNYPRRSMRFRSNGSFVCYLGVGEVMEGNWEPTATGIRIFGKRYRTDYYSSIYLQEMKANTGIKIFQAPIEIVDPAKLSFEQFKKYFKPILADRGFYENLAKKSPPFSWWTGVKPYGQVKLTAANEEGLMKAAYEFAVAQKGLLLSSSLFTDIYLPGDKLQQIYYGP